MRPPRYFRRCWIDDALAERGRTWRIVYTMPTYGPARPILSITCLVLTRPASIARIFSAGEGVIILPCPLATPRDVKGIDMIWHARLGHHPAHMWLRSVLRDVAANIAP